jgi:PBP1b-binding outer membrane lipoprotein LpoB
VKISTPNFFASAQRLATILFLSLSLAGCSATPVEELEVQITPSPTPTITSTPSPKSTPSKAPTAPKANACKAARAGNENFVEVINGVQNGTMSNSKAANLAGKIERSLDSARKTITNTSFESAMLEMANIIGIAKLSLENNDLDSYQVMVNEFISAGGYFRSYC